MNRVDNNRFAEMLDDVEEALSAQEVLQGLFQTQIVAEDVREVLLDSRLPNGQFRTAR